MAAQQILLGETVAAMKKALKRTAYDSDSDNEIEAYSNRGNKLKKRALFAHQGQLAPPTGPEVYKEAVEYGGQQRYIINRNPPVLDDEGYEVDSDEEDDEDERVQDAIASAAELNPYSKVHIEQLLAPLTASTDLPSHPTLSKPFTADTLTNLADQSCQIMRKENQSLWRIKHLFTRFIGDHTWAPCEMMIGPNDIELFSDEAMTKHMLESAAATAAQNNNSSASDGSSGKAPGEAANESHLEPGDNDVSMVDVANTNGTADKEGPEKNKDETMPGNQQKRTGPHEPPATAGNGSKPEENGAKSDDRRDETKAQDEEVNSKDAKKEDVEMQEGSSPPAAGKPAEMVEEILSMIHPMFHPPPNAQPDHGGLSEVEAEEMKRLVALYVQKQEEVCRGAHKLHEGLLKADRLRHTVLRWSKAEAHCGENRDLSDGEDWFDKEEWGLAEDLKKGQDEEEEETAPNTKKTRNRRQ